MGDAVNQSQAFWQSQSEQYGDVNRGAKSRDKPNNAEFVSQSTPEFTLGLSSFNESERHQFGQSLRLSMALIHGRNTVAAAPGKALPDDLSSIRQRLTSLNQDLSSNLADQLELLVRYDDLKGWQASGARHCAAWMNLELGISLKLAWEYLRVGRQLRLLPIVTALFRAGQLSWSKVRLISRVANDDNEALLCHAALDASASQVEQLCHDNRWQDDAEDRSEGRERALRQWEARALRWDNNRDGTVSIRITLPPEVAQAFLNSVEYSLAQLEPDTTGTNETRANQETKANQDIQETQAIKKTSMAQRRADAAVLMAENNLQSAGRDTATADRYQVIVSVDAAELSDSPVSNKTENGSVIPNTIIPNKRPVILGTGCGTTPIAKDTARRLACDCSLSALFNHQGEPVDIGQKSRLWPAAMARAIKARDKQCVFPGCTHSRHLHIHHIVHWADGGSTRVDNAACLCAYHHTLVHEGGYRVERVDRDEKLLAEQFQQQTADPNDLNTKPGTTPIEQRLRNSRASFDAVRQVSKERFRFRVVDRIERDVCGTLTETDLNTI